MGKAKLSRLRKEVCESSSKINMARRWDFYFKNGLLIKLPAEETFVTLKKFMNLDFNKMDYNKIGVIDLRIPERLIIENK